MYKIIDFGVWVKNRNSGQQPASIKEAVFGLHPKGGCTASRPALSWQLFMEAGVRVEFEILLPSIQFYIHLIDGCNSSKFAA